MLFRRTEGRLVGVLIVVGAFYFLDHPRLLTDLETGGPGRDMAPQASFSMQNVFPNPSLTPGAINPAVTQENIDSTICQRGWTLTIRPDESYTENLKWEQIRQYGYADRHLGDYEEDHLISLELGGSPTSPENLWPEPHDAPGGWGSFAKDRLENRLHYLVCSGEVSLDDAQHMIATNWVSAYRRYIGPVPDDERTY
jgi:hypothetical protein